METKVKASITRLSNGSWSDAERLTQDVSIVCNGEEGIAIISVFECPLSIRAFIAELSSKVTKAFSVKEKVTKKGEVYYSILLNPTYTDTSVGI